MLKTDESLCMYVCVQWGECACVWKVPLYVCFQCCDGLCEEAVSEVVWPTSDQLVAPLAGGNRQQVKQVGSRTCTVSDNCFSYAATAGSAAVLQEEGHSLVGLVVCLGMVGYTDILICSVQYDMQCMSYCKWTASGVQAVNINFSLLFLLSRLVKCRHCVLDDCPGVQEKLAVNAVTIDVSIH